MTLTWAVELYENFLPSFKTYESQYIPPVDNTSRIVAGADVDPIIARALADVVVTVANFKKTGSCERPLYCSQVHPRVREIIIGPWTTYVLTDETKIPPKALVMEVIHTKDLNRQTIEALVRTVREKLSQWRQQHQPMPNLQD